MSLNNFFPTRLPRWLLTVAVLSVPSVAVHADEIRVEGRTYRDATLRTFDGEFLIFVDANGDTVARKLSEIKSISADSMSGLEEFNRGERLLPRGKFREAAVKYQKSLARARGFWKALIQARYLSACDQAGDLDKAVETFIALAQALPEKADHLMPTNIAAAPPDRQTRALALLESAAQRLSTQPAYWHIEALRLSILEATDRADAGREASKIISKLPDGVDEASRHRLEIIAVRIEVKHEQYASALQQIDRLLGTAGEKYVPELLFLKARSLYGLALRRDDYLRSGLAFMRVVIHYPKSRFCAESMYWSALVHEKIERSQKAMELFQSSLELPGADHRVQQLVAEALQRLRASG